MEEGSRGQRQQHSAAKQHDLCLGRTKYKFAGNRGAHCISHPDCARRQPAGASASRLSQPLARRQGQFGRAGPCNRTNAVLFTEYDLRGVVQVLQDTFRMAVDQHSFQAVIEQGALRTWYMGAADFTKFAQRADIEQRALMGKYGFARK